MNATPHMLAIGFVAALSLLSGCNGKPDSPVSAQASAPENSTSGTGQHASPAPPAEVVDRFLNALREGEQETAEHLLTRKAREETAKRNLSVQPPGSPSIKFQIVGTEFLGADNNAAHVVSTWSEPSSDGSLTDYEIVWALRRQDDGWRIAGMATKLVENQPAIFLNFEDPEDMLAKWAEADRVANGHGEERHANAGGSLEGDTLR